VFSYLKDTPSNDPVLSLQHKKNWEGIFLYIVYQFSKKMRIINKSQEKIQVKTAMPYWFVHERSWVKFQAKNKDYKIDIGYNSAYIALVKC
jgi:hypothetical protein